MIIKTKLPQGIKPKITIPSDENVHKHIEYIRGSKYECAILLCMLGLRRSEMLAVTADKLQGNILTIDAALVSNDDGEFILKTTKTTSSTRQIWVPDYVADLIQKNGVAFDGFAGNVLRYLHRAQDALGLPRCRLHDLRHYYVSMSHSLGIPDAYIQQAVGHSSIQTTRNVYLHAQTEKIEDMERRAAGFLIK
jgi:integrase